MSLPATIDIHDLPEDKQYEVIEFVQFLKYKYKKTVEKVKIDDFSFAKSRERLKNYKGCLSDAVIEERRSYV